MGARRPGTNVEQRGSAYDKQARLRHVSGLTAGSLGTPCFNCEMPQAVSCKATEPAWLLRSGLASNGLKRQDLLALPALSLGSLS